MQRLIKFLKQVFAEPDREEFPAPASGMTLNDVLRICSGRMRNGNRPEPLQTALWQIGICRYHSESDLHDQSHRLDHSLRGTANLTVILVLSDFLKGNLRAGIHWPRIARRLVVVPYARHWSRMDSLEDWVLSAGSREWDSNELCWDFRESPARSATISCHNEQLILVLPSNTPARDVM